MDGVFLIEGGARRGMKSCPSHNKAGNSGRAQTPPRGRIRGGVCCASEILNIKNVHLISN